MPAKIFLTVVLYSIALTTARLASCKVPNYKTYEVITNVEAALKFVRTWLHNSHYEFLDVPGLNKSVHIRVRDIHQQEFEKDLESYMSNELPKEVPHVQTVNNSSDTRIFDKYLRYDEINSYLDGLAKAHPELINVTTLGKTFEKREIKKIAIGHGGKGGKTILIDAGIHAREWIAPASALYVIHQLVENYHANSHLLKNYTWIIIPVLNPDGYEYSHTQNRSWHKNRSPSNSNCYGTDLNRNFDIHWDNSEDPIDSCSENYIGREAASEEETKLLSALMNSLSGQAKFYLNLHSDKKGILYPWGYSYSYAPNWRDMYKVGQAGADAIRSYNGAKYIVESSGLSLYISGGNSIDYAISAAKIPVAIRYNSASDPPVDQIKSLVAETWVGIKAMAEAVISKY